MGHVLWFLKGGFAKGRLQSLSASCSNGLLLGIGFGKVLAVILFALPRWPVVCFVFSFD